MSEIAPDEEAHASPLEEARRFEGLLGVGDQEQDRQNRTGKTIPSAASSDAERQHNANVFGLTYRERTTRTEHQRCIILCLDPHPKRVNQCPSCYQRAVPMDIYMAKLDPIPGRGEAFARGLGEWFAAFRDGLELLRWRKPEPEPAWVMVQVGVICKGEAFV